MKVQTFLSCFGLLTAIVLAGCSQQPVDNELVREGVKKQLRVYFSMKDEKSSKNEKTNYEILNYKCIYQKRGIGDTVTVKYQSDVRIKDKGISQIEGRIMYLHKSGTYFLDGFGDIQERGEDGAILGKVKDGTMQGVGVQPAQQPQNDKTAPDDRVK